MQYWPQINDLLCWWIFYKLDETPSEDVKPELIQEWIADVYRNAKTHHQIHSTLYEEYSEFREKFKAPDMTVSHVIALKKN